jgi:hypothetical protein
MIPPVAVFLCRWAQHLGLSIATSSALLPRSPATRLIHAPKQKVRDESSWGVHRLVTCTTSEGWRRRFLSELHHVPYQKRLPIALRREVFHCAGTRTAPPGRRPDGDATLAAPATRHHVPRAPDRLTPSAHHDTVHFVHNAPGARVNRAERVAQDSAADRHRPDLGNASEGRPSTDPFPLHHVQEARRRSSGGAPCPAPCSTSCSPKHDRFGKR